MNKNLLLTIAISARPFVVAATQAGYVVTAIDAFADKQTVELAETSIVVNYDKFGFNADELLRVIGQLNTSQYLGFVYGSGFESQPELLQEIANIIPLIGNSAAIVQAVKTASIFFPTLDFLEISYPKIFNKLPVDFSVSYLKKFAGGCGGAHIKIVNDDSDVLSNNYYFQEQVDGRSISLLFVANSRYIEPIGFNEQWLSPCTTAPFRYGGAVSNIALSSAVQQQVIYAAEALTREFGLLGLNSLDVIVRNDSAYILEINPRLSATFDLYSANLYQSVDDNIINMHLRASLEADKFPLNSVEKPIQENMQSTAHAVVYALESIVIGDLFEWPSWVVDIPYCAEHHDEKTIYAGEPICSVFAHAEDAATAKSLVQTRVELIKNLIGIC
ncbi:ATP-grasp domain-containing protein [Methylotenera sp.]|uniref:ATP-grasp domain-containing protein n=1 Tax=Methylotenera sp. TaxID=2051956 RepID=UPI0027369F63|nr:ATP-grasp domain-containing protein [Methylotenera sp.]MDP3210684.1 ATP-grasp domain-containing protein [Methylotenera sp.]